ncbi:unnamed protein product [Oncorhynchus mykiss]|uniref:Mitogen-activated protein kinase 8 interacting protein 2 n=1 Tax=Oncorhynchus mykiss TaxID=8022 RepID=A0A060YAG7_ONCMY|nr:unnamed protein product [Oncorhynchus mykiss]
MIDDEDEEDEEEEDEDEVDPDAPPSPTASPLSSPTLGTLKSRPTTLNLTTAVSQDSLNNNSSLSPKKGSWQDSLRNPTSQGECCPLLAGRLSPTHSCLEDGSHVMGQCPSQPAPQAPGSQSKGTPPKQAGEGAYPQSPRRPLLCDMEGNRRERPEYGSFGQHKSHPGSNEVINSSADPLIFRVTSLDDQSQCSDTEVDHDLNSADHNHKLSRSCTSTQRPIEVANDSNSPSSDPGIADMNAKRCYTTSDQDQDLSSPGSDSDIEGELEAAFACGGPLVSNMISSISETELDLTSDDSSSGRSSHLTNSIEEASSPTSDQELDPDTELEQDIGPRLIPTHADDYDGNSEGGSESESEDELSENSDSPWLLSNLVNKMISEGSYPISCPEDCFKRSVSISDTISPSSDIEPDASEEEDKEGTGLRKEGKDRDKREKSAEPPKGNAGKANERFGSCLYMNNPTADTIRPPDNDLMMLEGRKELDSPSLSDSVASDKDEGREMEAKPTGRSTASLERITTALRSRPDDDGLAYDSMKYTLVVDENTTLELVSLRRCTSVLSDDSELSTLCDDDPLGTGEVGNGQGNGGVRPELLSSSEDSSPEADMHFSKKFLNVFVNSTSRSSSTESFGLFSCTINGEERDQTHRAVYRFIPRHVDELELDVDDPLYVEEEEDDYWYRGYNMRTGERGIFPAFYAHEVIGQSKEIMGMKRNPAWMDSFSVQFLGSVEVPYHQGNGILCAAMQKIAIARKRTVHLRPPSLCELEISLQGVKLVMSLEDEYDTMDEFDRCSHFFQMKNISFCGCHPKNNCYFGFITKHPMLNRFACHVFVSQESMRRVAESVGRAFQEYYQEHLEYACPTEDIYLE